MVSNLFARRAIELCLCLAALPVVVPVCLVLMVIIRIETRGAPLFVQTRVGKDQVPFRLFKLRTMSVDTRDLPSHEAGAATITRVGRVLRRLKLDELPQLLNVTTGSMSLVGPRPCLPIQRILIEERAKRGLFAFRPGVTGPGQIIGVDMSEPQRLAEIEAGYFGRATFRDDVGLLWRTVAGGGMGDAALKSDIQ